MVDQQSPKSYIEELGDLTVRHAKEGSNLLVNLAIENNWQHYWILYMGKPTLVVVNPDGAHSVLLSPESQNSPEFTKIIEDHVGHVIPTMSGEELIGVKGAVSSFMGRRGDTEITRIVFEAASRMVDGWSNGQVINLQLQYPLLSMQILLGAFINADQEESLRIAAYIKDVASSVHKQEEGEASLKNDTRALFLKKTQQALDSGGSSLLKLMHSHRKISIEQLALEIMSTFIAGVAVPTSALIQYALHAYPDSIELAALNREKNPTFWELLSLVDKHDTPEEFVKDEDVQDWLHRLLLYSNPDTDGFTKIVGHDIVIDGITYPSGTRFWVSPFVLHRNKKYYGDAATIMSSQHGLPKGFYFHEGPHVCIGQNLARIMILVILYTIHQRYLLGAVDKDKVVKIWGLAPSFENALFQISQR